MLPEVGIEKVDSARTGARTGRRPPSSSWVACEGKPSPRSSWSLVVSSSAPRGHDMTRGARARGGPFWVKRPRGWSRAERKIFFQGERGTWAPATRPLVDGHPLLRRHNIRRVPGDMPTFDRQLSSRARIGAVGVSKSRPSASVGAARAPVAASKDAVSEKPISEAERFFAERLADTPDGARDAALGRAPLAESCGNRPTSAPPRRRTSPRVSTRRSSVRWRRFARATRIWTCRVARRTRYAQPSRTRSPARRRSRLTPPPPPPPSFPRSRLPSRLRADLDAARADLDAARANPPPATPIANERPAAPRVDSSPSPTMPLAPNPKPPPRIDDASTRKRTVTLFASPRKRRRRCFAAERTRSAASRTRRRRGRDARRRARRVGRHARQARTSHRGRRERGTRRDGGCRRAQAAEQKLEEEPATARARIGGGGRDASGDSRERGGGSLSGGGISRCVRSLGGDGGSDARTRRASRDVSRVGRGARGISRRGDAASRDNRKTSRRGYHRDARSRARRGRGRRGRRRAGRGCARGGAFGARRGA